VEVEQHSVALVLSVLVILGLVVGVRVVRKDRGHRQHADRGGGRGTRHAGTVGTSSVGLGADKYCAPSHQGRSVDGLGIPAEDRGRFEYAAKLGYDGVELMVWAETVSQDVDAIELMAKRYDVPVLSVARAVPADLAGGVWGANPIPKLERSVRAAEQLGAHDRRRASRRSVGSAAMPKVSPSRLPSWRHPATCRGGGEHVSVRADRFFFGAGQTSIERMRKRGGRPGPGISAFARPTTRWTATTPTTRSTCRTPRPRAPMRSYMARRMGDGLVHLQPVRRQRRLHRRAPDSRPRTQPTGRSCEMLATSDFSGHVILEVTTSGARTAAEREALAA